MAKLKQADILIGHGEAVPEACKEIDASKQTYYRRRQKYGGRSPDMIKQFRALRRQTPRPMKRLWVTQCS